MDPDENLDESRDLTEHLRGQIENEDHGFTEEDVASTDRLIDLVKAQDEWLMKGGFLPKEWALRAHGGLIKRAELARRVYEEALSHTETFDGDLGVQLAYLFGAILKNDRLQLHLDVVEEAEVLEFFQAIFPEGHPVWAFIQTDDVIARAS